MLMLFVCGWTGKVGLGGGGGDLEQMLLEQKHVQITVLNLKFGNNVLNFGDTSKILKLMNFYILYM